MNRWVRRALLVLILLVAAALRLTGIDWDNYDHHHPDERYITWVAATIEWPADLASAFQPALSSFNPYYWPPDAESKGIEVIRDEQRKFAYGHFPLYAGVATTRLLERLGPALASGLPESWLFTRDILNAAHLVEYRHLTAVVRALTALIDVGTVGLIYLLGRRVYGAAVGLLAAAFLALTVTHIQLAHFFAFDPYMTFFVVAAVYFMVLSVPAIAAVEGENSDPSPVNSSHGSPRATSRRSSWALVAAAACIGLAVGSKFAAIMLFLPLLVTVYLAKSKARAWTIAGLIGVAVVVFAITNPFAFLDLTCELITPAIEIGPFQIPALDWRSCFLDNISTQGAMARGAIDLPFTRQYQGTLPFLYYLEMQLRWGMGVSLGLVAFTGFGWVILRALKGFKPREWRHGFHQTIRQLRPPTLVLLSWSLPFFITTGSFYAKFMRYMQPVTPFFILFGAAMLCQLRHVAWRRVTIALVLLLTGLYALSFIGIYQQPHPWTAASRWIYANVKPGDLILSEQWDDALPGSLVVDGKQRKRSEYENEQLTWLAQAGSRDDVDKLDANLELLAHADYLTLVSNRIYGVVPRLPERYPISSQYHQLLFDGSLGYEVVAVFGRFPQLFGFHLIPDTFRWPGLKPPATVVDYLSSVRGINWGRADESFTVYDQPLTMIFKNVGGLKAADMRLMFELDE